MKKKIILVFLMTLGVFTIPNSAQAKSCSPIKGTGENIGDEIRCGTEDFYVVSNDGKTVKMLSKYNLNVGYKIEKDTEEFVFSDQATNRCEELKKTGKYDKVLFTRKVTIDGKTDVCFCRLLTKIDYDEVLQSENAKGLYPNGNKEVAYPIYGIDDLVVYDLEENVNYLERHPLLDYVLRKYQEYNLIDEVDVNDEKVIEQLISDLNYGFPYANIDVSKTNFAEYFDGYRETLNSYGLDVENISLMTIPEFEELLENITGNKHNIIEELSSGILDLALKFEMTGENTTEEEFLSVLHFYEDYELTVFKTNYLKELDESKYGWLHSTSSWLGTAYALYNSLLLPFNTTLGEVCSSAEGCYQPYMGLGIRPLVTISIDDISTYTYTFLEGDNQKFELAKVDNYKFKVDGDYELFDSLVIGDLTLEKDIDYKVTEGSTVIEFTESGLAKLNTFESKEYVVEVNYSNGKQAKGTLIIDEGAIDEGITDEDIVEEVAPIEVPFTFDSVMTWVLLTGVSMIAILGMIITQKKQR